MECLLKKAEKCLKKKRERLSENNNIIKCDYYRPINQYDLDGNFIRTWRDTRELLEVYTSNQVTCIRDCCDRVKNRITFNYFQWRYADDCDDVGKVQRNKKDMSKKKKTIICTNLSTGETLVFKGKKECIENIDNITEYYLNRILYGTMDNYNGYTFTYA